MKQLHKTLPHYTSDLTACRINRIFDVNGVPHFILSYPVEWEAGEKQAMTLMSGDTVMMRQYLVKEWDEVELELKK